MSNTPDKARLEELAHKWLTGQLHGKEQREFNEWLNKINNKPLKVPLSFGESEEEHARELFRKIQSEISAAEVKSARPPWKLPAIWRRVAAAAAVILLAGSGLFFLAREQASDPPSETVYGNDVAPGGNRAYLTLSGGKRIALTDASEGILAIQKGVEVSKTADGELVYRLTVQAAPPVHAEIEYNTIETPKGGQYQVYLPDGSHVWLNSASSITFPVAFTDEERHVEISGEGYFEVHHDPSRPFRVDIAGKMRVEVLGTTFNVTAYPDENMLETTLLEGSVQVSLPGTTGKGTPFREMVPGQQARLRTESSGTKPELNIVRLKQPEEAIAWRNGLISFKNANMKSIMRRLSRWYNLEVVYKGSIPERYYSGTIKRNANLSEALEMLHLVSGAKFEVRDRKVAVEIAE